MSFIEARGGDLNPAQLNAVVTTEGPVLVLAGAGSGKTRVLTYRIAHLIYDKRVPIPSILAMTFSNKAAKEMHDRVKKLLNDESAMRYPWISTFHSVCARLLRMYGGRIGYKPTFVIYDTGEQLTMIKDAMENLGFMDKSIDPDAVHKRIGEWKNEGTMPDQAEQRSQSTFDHRAALTYKRYAAEMQRVQAMDFDDLLLLAYKLFHENEDLRLQIQNQWRYVLIDEFQDTNDIQYRFLKEILNPERNLCVVGDDDQSIYGWRGAKLENILNFDKEHDAATVVKLEQNYRSTGNILDAADAVISKNEMRHEKKLWTAEGKGERIRIAILEDDRGETFFVISEIRRLMREHGYTPKDFAVFYRMNSLSRGFEEECLKNRIPYRIVGGFRFYERKEIKDLLSYFKLLLNPYDIMAFRRTVNTPLRGVGPTSIEKMELAAAQAQLAIMDWVEATAIAPVTGKAKLGYDSYRKYVLWGREAIKSTESLVDLFIDGIQRTGYVDMLKALGGDEAAERQANIEELLSAVQEFEEQWQEPENFTPTPTEGVLYRKLCDFVERVSLIADVDQMDEAKDQLTLMSIHAAKGLEFKVCFIVGMEEGLFPSSRSFDSYARTEEERRLCYVGVTRAREKLYLTRANRRRTFGQINYAVASRFFKDIPAELLETVREEGGISQHMSWGSTSSGYGGGSAYPKKKPQFADFDFDQRTDDDFENAVEFSYHKGDRVSHPSFGSGIVQKAELMGEDECLSIVFAGRGLKKVLARFVKRAS